MKMVTTSPAGRPALFRQGSKAYDFLAAAPLIVWFALNAVATLGLMRILSGQLLMRPDAPLALTLLSKCAVVLFAIVVISMLILRAPPQSGARGIAPRIAGLLGTYLAVAVVLLPPAQLSPAWMAVASALILGGMAFACFSVLWLGRSFSVMAEARQLVTSGPYSVIRHPLPLCRTGDCDHRHEHHVLLSFRTFASGGPDRRVSCIGWLRGRGAGIGVS